MIWPFKRDPSTYLTRILKKLEGVTNNEINYWGGSSIEARKVKVSAKYGSARRGLFYKVYYNHQIIPLNFGEARLIKNTILKTMDDYYKHINELNRNKALDDLMGVTTVKMAATEITIQMNRGKIVRQEGGYIWVKKESE